MPAVHRYTDRCNLFVYFYSALQFPTLERSAYTATYPYPPACDCGSSDTNITADTRRASAYIECQYLVALIILNIDTEHGAENAAHTHAGRHPAQLTAMAPTIQPIMSRMCHRASARAPQPLPCGSPSCSPAGGGSAVGLDGPILEIIRVKSPGPELAGTAG